MSRPALGPTSLLSNRYGGSFPGVKQQEREADHSPPLPQYVMGWCLVKHRDNFNRSHNLPYSCVDVIKVKGKVVPVL
jgi:hypothetical protein